MSDEAKKVEDIDDRFSDPTRDLLGKQSIRTTFKLKKETIATIAELAKEYSVTQKEVFDIVCDKLLREKEIQSLVVDRRSYLPEGSIRKTYVLSRTALVVLNQFSEKAGVTRDELVVTLFESFKQLIAISREKELELHGEAVEIINNFNATVHGVQEQITQLLGPADPIALRFNKIMILTEKLWTDVGLESDDGFPIRTDPIG